MNPITPSSLSSLSFSLSVWMLLDAAHFSTPQVLFHDIADNFKVQLTPASSMVDVAFDSSSFSAESFPLSKHPLITPDSVGWKFLGVGQSMKSSSFRLCVVGVQDIIESGIVSSGLFSISGFTLGSSLYGTLRDFRLYTTFMGPETFGFSSLSKHPLT